MVWDGEGMIPIAFYMLPVLKIEHMEQSCAGHGDGREEGKKEIRLVSISLYGFP